MNDEIKQLSQKGYSARAIIEKLNLTIGVRQLQRLLKKEEVAKWSNVVDKKCAACKERKPLTEYFPNRSNKDGLHTFCKPCESKRMRGRINQVREYRVKRIATDPVFKKAYASRHEKDKVKDSARKKVQYAVKTGNIERQPCHFRDNELPCGRGVTVAHHEDYDKPLDVIWICQLHHRRYHLGELVI